MKRISSLVIALMMVLLSVVQCQIVAFAAGTKKSNATEVQADNQINYGTISSGGVHDWYYISTGEENAYYDFTIHNESGTENIHLVVYSSRDEQLLDVGYYTGAGQELTGSINLLPNETYYFKVYLNDKGTGNYYFIVNKHVDVIGNSNETAQEIQLNELVESTIDGTGDRDYYVFTTGDIKQDYKVIFNNISGTTNGHVQIYSARDEQMLDVGYYTGAGSSAEDNVTLNANTTYYAIVYLNDDGTGSYSFRVTQCADGHTSGDVWVTTKEPTCNGVGERAKVCSICKEVLETEQVEAKGHTFGEWKTKVSATWISLGEKEAVCEYCGEIDTKKDWSKAWILPVIILGAIVLIVGIVNYIKSFKRSSY